MGMAMRVIMSTTPMLNTRGPNTLGRYCTLELGVSSTDTSCKGSITNTQGTLDLSRQLPMCRQPAEMRGGGISVPSADTQEKRRLTSHNRQQPPRAAGCTHLVVEPNTDTLMGLQLGRIEPHFHLNNGGTIRPAMGPKQWQRLRARLVSQHHDAQLPTARTKYSPMHQHILLCLVVECDREARVQSSHLSACHGVRQQEHGDVWRGGLGGGDCASGEAVAWRDGQQRSGWRQRTRPTPHTGPCKAQGAEQWRPLHTGRFQPAVGFICVLPCR